ncbi:carboxypeptidase [Hungatella hathewayi 12489931]|uniref:carboxypeptidase M32 n=1 Tax=Hungatella hathewayi TaxID=154046 RepID=UPI0002D20D35|nr:carboxypeptidase M32 [Hungatella hathewayi]ENY97946.1 carboxypeptidase [Hungatella hathewayi 12489931]
MSKGFKDLEKILEKTMALQTALALLEWDDETLAPEEAGPYTERVIGALSEEYYQIIAGEEMKNSIAACEDEKDLTEVEKAIVKEAKETRAQLVCIPVKEYRDNAQLVTEGIRVWTKSKAENDFGQFVPVLQRLVDYQKKFASYRAKKGEKLYDSMLDLYEKDFNMELLDAFFEELKEVIVPLIREIRDHGKPIEDGFLTGDYPEDRQREAAEYLANYVGFDFKKGVMGISAHPFTTNLHNHDVRITTHYSNRMDSSVFSVIHETGHAIYELGISDELTQTLVGQGASTGMHECQSRFFENIIGRSAAFWVPLYEKLQSIFPEQLKGVSREQFVEAINKAEPGLIRTEADELTYSLHVMIRYEIEKMMIEENLDLTKLPDIWADKYEEYLGIRPANAAEGVLQDIHWSEGCFGYFPSYALGSAFGAQLYYHMKKEMDINGLLENGEIGVIREYLREHIHRFGKRKTSRDILKDITGEDFNPRYYVRYLKEKYSQLYDL